MRAAAACVVALASLGVASPALAREPIDCSTPKKAAATFFGNMTTDAEDVHAASECFDWAGAGIADVTQRRTLTRDLKAVLDARGVWFDESLPDRAESSAEYIYLSPDLREVRLHRAGERWVFTSATIGTIERLHAETFDVDVQSYVERLPRWARGVALLGVRWWQILGLFILILLGLAVRLTIAKVLEKQSQRLLATRGERASLSTIREAARPIGTLAMAAVFAYGFPLLRFGARPMHVGRVAIRVMAALAAVVLLYRIVDLGADIFAKRAERTETKLDDQVVPLVRKTLKVFVIAIGVIFVLQNLDVDVGSLLAGASIGGLAFTLAAKDTVANFFGSVSIFADQPFQVGNWVVIDEHEGIVEEVGMRSTRIRTFRRSVVTIPNSTVANAGIENYGMRERRRCKLTLGLTYDTTSDQMRAFVEGVRAILIAHEDVWQEDFEVAFRSFGDSALEVLVYFFFVVDSWTKELIARQEVMLQIMRLAEALGVEFAFPTQTVHLEKEGKRAAAPKPDALRDIVTSFGPGGANATLPEALTTFAEREKTSSGGEEVGDGG